MLHRHLHLILRALSSLPPSRARTAPALVIHAHKADLLSQSSPPNAQTLQLAKDRTKTVLERELEKRRRTFAKGVAVEGLGGGADGNDLGATGLDCTTDDGTFRFDKWDGPSGVGEVEFTAGWVDVVRDDGIAGTEKVAVRPAEGGEDGLEELKEWLVSPL